MGKIELFTQNERNLIGVDNKNRVKLWDKSTFKNYKNITKFNRTVKSIALLENDLLAVGSCGINKIEIWNITNQSIILALNEHISCVNALVSFKHLNETYLLSGSSNSTNIRLYDSGFKCIQTLNENTGSILSLKYSYLLSMIASNSSNGNIKILTFTYKLLNDNLQAHKKSVKTICVLENGLIATGSEDWTINIWKIVNKSSFELVTTLKEHKSEVKALILLKNNSLVSSGSTESSIRVWNKINESTFECVRILDLNNSVFSLAISGSSLLIIGLRDGSIQIRDQTSFSLLQILKRHTNTVLSILLLNNDYLASASVDYKIMIWQRINETSFNDISKTLSEHTLVVKSLIVLPNNMFASASSDNSIRIWDQTTFKCIKVLEAHINIVMSLIVFQNKYLISISEDKTIIVWNIFEQFSRITTTSKSDHGLNSVALTSSNDLLITGDSEGQLKLWDMNSVEISVLAELNQNSKEVSSLIFYKNFLITGHFDGSLKIWRTDSFQLWYSPKAHNSSVTCLTNIDDRNLFASGSTDNQIKIWDSNFAIIQTAGVGR